MIHIRTTSRRARFHSISWRPDPPGGPNKAGEVLIGDSFDVIAIENRQNMIEIEILGTATPGARNILPATLPRFHPEIIHPGQIDVLGNPGKRPARRRPVQIDAEETRGDPRVGAAPGCGYDAHVTRFIGNTVGHVLDDVELGHSKSPPSLKRRSGPLETERLVRSSRRVLRVGRPARVVLMDGDEIRNRHPRHAPLEPCVSWPHLPHAPRVGGDRRRTAASRPPDQLAGHEATLPRHHRRRPVTATSVVVVLREILRFSILR